MPAGRAGKREQMADEQPFGDDHAKAALKIQTRARVRSDATRVEKLKAEGMLPGQVRSRKIEEWGAATFSRFSSATAAIGPCPGIFNNLSPFRIWQARACCS